MKESEKGKTGRLIIERTFNSSKELVFKAWSEPELYKRWTGPKNFTCPFVKMDFRTGGKYLSAMKSPDGKTFWSTGIYKEIIPNQKITATDSFADEQGKVVPASYYGMQGDLAEEFYVTVQFSEKDGKTLMKLIHQPFPEGEIMESARHGWNESFDKLQILLMGVKEDPGKKTLLIAEPGKQETVVVRTLNSSREKVFEALITPDLVSKWWGPKFITTRVEELDPVPGGKWRILQNDQQGNEYSFNGYYHLIKKPEQLVYTFEYEAMPGHIMLETITLEDQNGKTRFTDHSVFQNIEDRDGMISAGMEAGAFECMDLLEDLLAGKIRQEAVV